MVDLATPRHTKDWKLTRWVGFLLIGVGIIVLSYPAWPIIRYKFTGPVSTPQAPVFPYESNLVAADGTVTENSDGQAQLATNTPAPATEKKVRARVVNRARPADNRLVIPKIGVNLPIHEGTNEAAALNGGAWHIPGSSSPDQGGNTVLSGHRFQYRPPSNLTLYLLNELKKGDIMIIYWKGKEYDFRVSTTQILPKERTDVAQPTLDTRLTVTTCHPLFSTKERLVVVGELL